MDREFGPIRNTLTRYANYITKKKNAQDELRRTETTRRPKRVPLVFLRGFEDVEDDIEQPAVVSVVKFRTLKTYIDDKISERRLIMANKVVVNMLRQREYDKNDLDYMIEITTLLRNDINDHIDRETKRAVEEVMRQQQKIEEEKNKITMMVPRFSTGMQMYNDMWNEFSYPNDQSIRDIFLHYNTVGEMFVGVFYALIRDISDETSIINIANGMNSPMDKKMLENMPRYRTITYHLGFLLGNPMIEKEFNEHVSFLCLFIWWRHFAQQKDISNAEFVATNMTAAYKQLADHYTTQFSPVMKRAIHVHKRKGYEMSPKIQAFLNTCVMCDYLTSTTFDSNGLSKVFVAHEQVSIEAFKQWITFVVIEMNDCFSEMMQSRLRDAKNMADTSNIISVSRVDSTPTSASSTEMNESDDFFDGEKLLAWFIDTNINKDLLFSRFSTIYLFDNNGGIEHKFVIAHNASEYVNYQQYGVLSDYICDTSIERIIPSEDKKLMPMLNLSPYLFVFLSAVAVNPASFENEPQEMPHVICENLFLMIVYIVERSNISNIVPWWRVAGSVEAEHLQEIPPSITKNVILFEIGSKMDHERAVVDVVFIDVCRRCLFATSKALIDFFTETNVETTATIQSILLKHPLFSDRTKENKNCLWQFINGVKKNSQLTTRCLRSILTYLFSETNKHSVARFIVALKIMQSTFHDITSSRKRHEPVADNPIEKLEQDFFRRVSLVLKNRRYQEELSIGGDSLIASLANLSSFGARIAASNVKKSTSKPVMNNIVTNLLGILFGFMKKKLSPIDQNDVMDYISKCITKVFVAMTDPSLMDIGWLRSIIVDHGVKPNVHFVDFIDEICRYYQSLSNPDDSRMIAHISLQFEAFFKNKPVNANNLTKMHEIARCLVFLRFYYNASETDELTNIIKRAIEDKKLIFEKIEQKKLQKQMIHDPIGAIYNMPAKTMVADVNVLFDQKRHEDIAESFDVINFFMQLFALSSHHFLWQNVSSSALNVILQRFVDKVPFDIEIQSYYDINEDNSRTLKRKTRFDVDAIDVAISTLLGFEHFIIEKTNRCGHVFSSLTQMYTAAERCRKFLGAIGITTIDTLSHTPESKMIAWMMAFIKYIIVSAFDRALRESRYPEDAFAIILSEHKQTTIELCQTIINYIATTYGRVNLAASISRHVHIKKTNGETTKSLRDSTDFIMNPFKYFIKDALLSHPFHVRMLQIHIKNRQTILSRAWLILPYKIAKEKISANGDHEKTLAYLNENSVRVEMFDKQHNPSNYLMWRFWFMNLPFVDNTILLKQRKPIGGCAYFLTCEPPPPPLCHSDSLVLNRSNNMTSPACSSLPPP